MNSYDYIEINGRRYDCETGLPLAENSPKHTAVKVVKVKVGSAEVKHVKTSLQFNDSRGTNHAKPHTPHASKLLMRQAVKKPGPSLKRQIKAQGALSPHKHARAPLSAADPRQEVRVKHSLSTPRSHQVLHFSPNHAANHYSTQTPSTVVHPYPVTHRSTKRVEPVAETKRTKTTAEILDRALREATAHEQPLLPKPRHHARKRPRLLAKLSAA